MMDFENRTGNEDFDVAEDVANQVQSRGPAVPLAGATVLMPDAQGVVILPAGVELEDLQVLGRDLVIVAADGTRYVVLDGAIIVPQLVVGGVAIPPVNLAALLLGDEPEPAAGNPQSSGGNFAGPVGVIQSAYDLGDLLPYTELTFPQAEEREIIPDIVDRDPDVLIEDGGPVGRDVTDAVDEAALSALRPNGNLESAGSNAGSGGHETSGTIFVTSPDGIDAITINGVTVTGQAGQQIVTPSGTLTLGALTNEQIVYTYTLNDNTSGDNTTDVFTVIVTDPDGDKATARLTIAVTDDVPEAVDDFASQTTENAPVIINVLANDTPGADGVALSQVALVSGSLSGAGSVAYSGDGTFTYTPASNELGVVTFDYTITDGDGDTSTATVSISLAADSEPVVSVTDGVVDEAALGDGSNPASTAETDTGTFTITTGNDTLASLVINGTDVTGGGVVNGTYGTLTVTLSGGNYSWSYTLDDNTLDHPTNPSTGTSEGIFDSFTVNVTDSDGSTDSDTLTIDVLDDGPDAVNDTTNTAEDTQVVYNVIANDTQGADTPAVLTAASLATAGAGTVTFAANGNVTFTPATGFSGDAVINYTIEDADGDPSSATLTVTVAADSPITVSVTDGVVDEAALGDGSNPASTAETDTGTFTITTGNDTLASLVINGTDVTGGGVVNGTYGTLTVTLSGGNYSWSYTLDDNTLDHPTNPSTGTSEGIFDSFTVNVTDSDGSTDSDTLTIDVLDDGPDAVNDTTNTAEDTQVVYNVIANDTQGADTPAVLTAASLATAGAGTVTFAANGNVTFTPATGFSGDAVINYTIEDADGDPSSATLTVTVAADSPITVSVTDGVVDEAALGDGSNPASTAETDTGTFTITTGNDTLASLVINGTDVTGGGVVNGTYGTLTVTLSGGNYSWSYTLDDNTLDHPTNPSTGTSEGIFDSFTVNVTDSDGSTDSDTLTIDVLDDGPDAVNDTTNTAEDTQVVYNVIANDTQGADTPAVLTAASLATAGAGTVTFAANGNVTFTPATGFSGDAVINYTIEDADGDPSSATLTVTVAADSPITVSVTDGVVDEAALGDGSNPASTAETDTGTFTITTGNDTLASLVINGTDVTGGGVVNGTYGTLTVTLSGGNYSWSYTLDDNTLDHPTNPSTGTSEGIFDSFTVNVTDSDGSTDSDTLTIDVLDDGPDAVNDTTNTAEDTQVVYNVIANDTQGADTPAVLTAASLATAGAGTVTFAANGNVTFTPATGFSGDAVINYTIEDADGDPSSATLTVTVAADSPITVSVTDGVVDEAALGDGSNPASTAETDTGTFTITTGNDTLASLVINGTDVTGGGVVNGTYGTLTVTLSGGNYSWSYTLDDNTLDHPTNPSTGTSEGIFDSFTVNVTDSDGSTDSDTLTIDVLDDGPDAVNDTTNTAEDTQVVYNVIANDTQGADTPAVLTAASLATAGAGTVTFAANGNVTFTPATGFSGDAVINYTIEDADGDPSSATLTVTVAADSPITVSVTDGVVDEAALGDGSNPASTAETDTGTFTITTGNDTLASLVINGTDVTGGGVVNGTYGTLTVTLSGGNYSWSYTLDDNTLDHPTNPSTGTSEGIFDSFTVNVTDSDGSTDSDTLTIDVLDDGPDAVNDTTNTAEDTQVVYNVIANDTQGADTPAVLTAASLATAGAGTVTFAANGNVTFTPATGFSGDAVINYTIEDADGDPSSATLTVTVAADSPITVSVTDGVVDEAALGDGSNPASTAETDTGTFTITTGNDTLASLVINGTDVTGGGVVNGTYGTLTVTLSGGNYSWSYTLDDNTLDHPTNPSTGTSEGIFDSFTVNVTDSDGSTDSDTLTIDVLDDGPDAVNDTTNTAEDTQVVYNVIANDTQGADTPAVLTAASLATAGAGTVTFAANGNVTFTPATGFSGDAVINYTIEDADGDPSSATLTVTVAADSPITVSVTDGVVDEAALGDGSNPASTAETDTGTFTITTGNDTLASLVINGTDVTGGGVVNGTYGTLTVTLSGGNYSWSYTLDDNTLDHPTNPSTGTSEGIFDSFTVNVTDSDGSTDSDTLTIDVLDDGPDAVNDTTNTAEDTQVVYNVIANDTQGADTPAVLTAASLATAGAGTVTFAANGNVTFTPATGFSGDAVINYTIEDADGDPSSATLTVTVAADSPITVSVTDGVVDEAALGDGSNPASTAETDTGTFTITTGNDTLASLVINGTDVTGGGVVNGTYGTLTVTLSGGNYSWSYTLDDNTLDHPTNPSTGTSEGIFDSFTVNVTDSDGSTDSDTLTIDVLDDGPDVTGTDSLSVDDTAADSDNGFIDFIAGADGLGGITIDGVSYTGTTLTLTTTVVGSVATTSYTPSGGGAAVELYRFEIIDANTGEYEFTVLNELPQPDPVTLNYTQNLDGSPIAPGGTPGIKGTVGGTTITVTPDAGDYIQVSNAGGSTRFFGVNDNNFNTGDTLTFQASGTPDSFDDIGFQIFQVGGQGDILSWSGFGDDGITYTGTITINAEGVYSLRDDSNPGTVPPLPADVSFEQVVLTVTSGSVKFGLFGSQITPPLSDIDLDYDLTIFDGDGDSALTSVLVHVNADGLVPPIVLDLDGDGVEFVGLDAGVTHDYGGGLVATAWVGADDGLLARNTGSGVDIVFTDDAAGASTDLEGVRLAYDSNGDGALDAADAAWADFGVWQDSNQDGTLDTGEFTSLSAAGITSIQLRTDGQAYSAENGDVAVFGSGVYTRADGSTGALADASFSTGPADRRVAEVTLATAIAGGLLIPELATANDNLATAEQRSSMVEHSGIHDAGTVLEPTDNSSDDPVQLASLFGAPRLAESAIETSRDFGNVPEDVQASIYDVHDSATVAQPDVASSEPVAEFSPASNDQFHADVGAALIDAILVNVTAAPDAEYAVQKDHADVGEVLADISAEAMVDSLINHLTDGGPSDNDVLPQAEELSTVLLNALDTPLFFGGTTMQATDAIDDVAQLAAAVHA